MMTRSEAALTVGDWFTSVEPAPPRALAAQLQTMIAADASRPASEVPEICLRVAEEHLQRLLTSGSTSRATAMDLLAVDALVTYAFEAAAGDASQIEARTKNAMSRIGTLAGQAQT
ncbi:MAG: hypothetical protein ABJB66_09280 [Gemmatimonadaceae bacterium]